MVGKGSKLIKLLILRACECIGTCVFGAGFAGKSLISHPHPNPSPAKAGEGLSSSAETIKAPLPLAGEGLGWGWTGDDLPPRAARKKPKVNTFTNSEERRSRVSKGEVARSRH